MHVLVHKLGSVSVLFKYNLGALHCTFLPIVTNEIEYFYSSSQQQQQQHRTTRVNFKKEQNPFTHAHAAAAHTSPLSSFRIRCVRVWVSVCVCVARLL